MRRVVIVLTLLVGCLCAAGLLAYQVPAVQERVDNRLSGLKANLQYAINPPEDVIFVPEKATNTPSYAIIASHPTATLDFSPSRTPTHPPEPTGTPTPLPTQTPVPTPIPAYVKLDGILHEYQMMNNCGPANLAMSLSYWGWRSDQREVGAFTKPNPQDKNVMPYELADFVSQKTDYKVEVRVGGNLDLLKSFIAAGFPVIVEKGFEDPAQKEKRFEGWMGHYELVNGYNDQYAVFTVQDSYDGPDRSVKYGDMQSQWRAFNFTYLVTFPADRAAQVQAMLGTQWDQKANYQHALEIATQETQQLAGRDLYFAWFNRGSSLVGLKDYAAAATAYDAAFANYPSIPEEQRPYRMMWYQTGPYFAYYYSQRYQDVLNLADATLKTVSVYKEPLLEESYYWRAQAKIVLGDNEGAIADLRTSLKAHPGFQPSLDLLAKLGQKP